MKKLLALFLVLFCSSRFVGQNILSITANTSTGCAPDSVDISYFDPGAVSYNVTINGYGYYQFLNTTSTTYSFNAPYGGNYSIYVDALDTSNSVIATGSTSINLKGLYAGELNSSISQGICPGDKISFWAGGYYENSVSTSWDMGNGTIYSQLPYSYIDYVYNSTGTYTVTCQASFDGCPSQTISDTIVITNSTLNVPFFESYIFPNDSVCPNTQVELIGPYQYSLNYDFGDGTFSSSSGVHSYQLTGSYPVSITAINGCGNTYTAFDTIRVVNNASYTEFLSIYVGGISQDSIVCPNTDLYFYANSSVASSYHWDFGNNDTTNLENPTRTFLTTGIKQISLTATNGCGNSKTVTKNIYVTDTIHPGSISVSAIDSICPNQPFYIDVNVPGAPYSDDDNYLYDFGDTSFSVGSSLVYYFTTPGNYNVNITYTNGCGNSVSYNQTIYSGSSAGTQPIVQFQNLGVVCAGDTAVFVSFPSGGSMTYQVDFGDGTPVTGAYSQIYADGELYNIYKHVYTSIGNFNATLTYASQCGGQQSISSPAGASSIAPASAEFFYDETINYCLGDEITFYAFGASSYEWDFGDGTGTLQTTGSLIPVKHRFNQPGIYKVNLVAYSNCGQLDSSYEYVNIPDSKIKIITNQVASNCGLSDGKAIAIASGGTLPYVYEWTNGDNGFIADSIPAGIYSVTVKDKKGCSNYSIATVSDIQGPTILVNNVIDASCNNGNNGVIDISVIGSSAPYSFVWSNGKTTEDINNLVAGPYEVIVTDANGCKATKSIYVEEPDPYYISFTSLLPPCGSNNGALTANILGNSGPYYFVWNNGVSTASNSGITAGIYNLIVVDSKGCLKQASAVLNNQFAPIISIDSVLPLNCNSGGASIYISGFGNNLTYNWSSGSSNFNTQDITGIGAGSYSVTVTDSIGCKASRIVDIIAVPPTENQICIVTVDTNTFTNKVIWEEVAQPGIAYYNIYRESSLAGLYYLVGNVDADSLHEYIDPVADPSIKPWRYKISAVNDCGEESEKSDFHKTIHLTVNKGLTDSVYNLIWDDYKGQSGYSSFYIWRYKNTTGWEKIDSVSSLDHSYTDNVMGYSQLTNLYYNIEAGPLPICDPSRGVINTTRSNIKQIIGNPWIDSLVGLTDAHLFQNFNVFPNPSKGSFTISGLKENSKHQILIRDLTGKLVYEFEITGSSESIHLETLSNGVYFLEVESINKKLVRRIIINR